MDRDDIIRMAREANPDVPMGDFPEDIARIFERFAALVAAKEREECIDDCECEATVDGTAQRIIERIRMRANQDPSNS